MRTATRYLYVVRHGEAGPSSSTTQGGRGEEEPSGLTGRGRRQAELLGRRLRDVPFATIHHGPLPRAAQTAQLI